MIKYDPDMMTLQQVAEKMNVPYPYLRDKISKQPDFPSPAINYSQKMRRWKRSDIDRYMKKQELLAEGA